MVIKIKYIANQLIKKIRFKSSKKYLKENLEVIDFDRIKRDLENLGLKQEDKVLVHSSLKSIGYVKNGPITVINALLDVLGDQGTLIIPTYYMIGTMYQTCMKKNYKFDYYKSPTVLGAIPSEFLKVEGIYRSVHPTHSISALGKHAKEITKYHHIGNKTFGKNSPWSKLYDLNGKILGIGISLGPTTQYHYIEDIMGKKFPINVYVDKIFKLKCKNAKGEYIYVEVQPHDPEVAKTRIDKRNNTFIRDYFWDIYEQLGILKVGKIGLAKSWLVEAKKFLDVLYQLANLGITIYSTEEELKEKLLYPFDLIKDKLKEFNN